MYNLNASLTQSYKSELYKKYSPIDEGNEKLLIELAQNGNTDAQNKLVNANLPQLIKLATSFSKSNSENEVSDLLAVATVEYIERIKSFDPSHGTRLISYALQHVRNEVRYYSQDNHTVRNSRQHSTSRPNPNYNDEIEYEAELRGITNEEMIALNKVPKRIDAEILHANSMDATITNDEDDSTNMHDTMENDGDNTDVYTMKNELNNMLSVLNEGDLQLLHTLYGINAVEMNGTELANEMGRTRQAINLRKQRVFTNIRNTNGIEVGA